MEEQKKLEVLFNEFNEKPIVYHKVYSKITNGVLPGLLLSQLVYWSKAMNHKEFYKTDQEFSEELGMGYYELRSAKKTLKNLGIIKTTVKGVPAKTYYQVNLDTLIELISQSSLGRDHNPVCDETTNWIGMTSQTNTESTTEITQKKRTSLRSVPFLEDKKLADTALLGKEKNKKNSAPPSTPLSELKNELSEHLVEPNQVKKSPPAKKTPRGFTNARRAEQGKPPLQNKRTQKQEETAEALKNIEYFKEQAYKIHGMEFLKNPTQKRNKEIRGKFIAGNKKVKGKAKEMIDWWMQGGGKWADYSPDPLFGEKQVEKFNNEQKKKNWKKGDGFNLAYLKKDY